MVTDENLQAAGGMISSSILSTQGASAIYKGGLTVRGCLPILLKVY